MCAQFHSRPETYLEEIRAEVPRYDELQDEAVKALPFAPRRVLELGIEVRLARMEDPLPDGPWDLVISVLSVHHLDGEQKRDLFRRVREQSRSLVIGDVVEVPPDRRVASLTPEFDRPAPATEQAEWCGGEVVWSVDDLAVIRAVYDA